MPTPMGGGWTKEAARANFKGWAKVREGHTCRLLWGLDQGGRAC